MNDTPLNLHFNSGRHAQMPLVLDMPSTATRAHQLPDGRWKFTNNNREFEDGLAIWSPEEMNDALQHAKVPVRVTLSRKAGWKIPLNTIIVDRRHPLFGNFFIPIDKGNAAHVAKAVEYFDRYLSGRTEQGFDCGPSTGVTMSHIPDWEHATRIKDALPQLKGKNLACWCKQGSPCHADVLLKMANH